MAILIRSLHIAGRHAFYLAAIGIMLFLLVLISAVWISNAVAERKDEIANWAGDKLGYPIQIGEAGLYWLDLFPKLYLTDLHIAEVDNASNWLEVEQLHIGLDLIASLRSREPVVDSVTLSGLSVTLIRDESGGITIEGMQPFEDETFDINSLLRMLHSVEVNRLRINYQDHQQPALNGHYKLQHATLEQADYHWQLSAMLTPPAQLGADLELQAMLELDEQHTLHDGRLRLKTDYLQLEPLRFLLDDQTLHLSQGGYVSALDLDAEKRGNTYRGSASFSLNQTVVITQKAGEVFDPVYLDRLSGAFSWEIDDTQWSVNGNNVVLAVAGEIWPQTSFAIKKTDQGWFEVSSPYLRLSDLTAFALLLEDMPEWLDQQRPAGDVRNLNLRFHPDHGLETAQVSLTNIAFLPWQEWPGINGLTADVDWQSNQLSLVLGSKSMTIYPEHWLPGSVFIDSLSGEIRWTHTDDGWLMTADRVHIWNDDLNLQLGGSLQQQNETMLSDIKVNVQDVTANRWLSYVPEKIVDEDFFAWAEPAFLDGVIREGSVVLRGDLAEFPFDESATGEFLFDLQVENANLHYADGWPDLQSVSGSVHGEGEQIRVHSNSGKIAGLDFIDVEVLIENVITGNSMLNVTGDVQGATNTALAFLNDSPLKSRFGPIADALSAEGNIVLSLVIDVPLADPYETDVKGQLDLTGSSLHLTEIATISLEQIEGVIKFDNDGVVGEDLKAMIFGGPITVDIKPQTAYTQVVARGRLTSQALLSAYPSIPSGIFNGSLAYQADLAVREIALGEFSVDLEISSDLQGLQIDMPAPFAKAADERRPMSIASRQTADGEVFSAHLDQLIDAKWRMEDQSFYGRVELGGGLAAEPSRDFVVRGQLESVDVLEWLDWYQSFADPEPDAAATTHYPDLVDLQINSLVLQQQQFNQVNLQVRRSGSVWRLNVGSENAHGEVRIPDAVATGAPIIMDFDRLVLHWPEASEAQLSAETESLVLPTPRTLWPSMNVHIRDFQVDEMRLGSMRLVAQKLANQWQLNELRLSSDVYEFNAEGLWQQLTSGDVTRLSFDARSQDLRAMLASFGYQQAIEANRAELQVELTWPGDPLDFSQRTMDGSLMIDVGSGRLLDIDPGAAGRIFGLLSFAALPRRLLLDFSDFFGKGMTFSGISGNFVFREGIAVTDNLVMRGDSANIAVTGPVNLVKRTYNQKVRVTPSVSSTLPLAGAVAGGPVGLAAGTAIFLVDRIAGRLFDRDIVDVISYTYDLTGPWDEPELKISRPGTQKEGSQPAASQ